MLAATEPKVIQPEEGTMEIGFGRPMFKLGSEQGATGLALIDSIVPSGGGFRFPHWHDRLEEAFYVLDGDLEYLLNDTWVTAGAGSTVFIPPGCVHAWRNGSSRPARQLVIGSSPELLGLIRELGTQPRDRWDAVCAAYQTSLAYDSPHFPSDAQPR